MKEMHPEASHSTDTNSLWALRLTKVSLLFFLLGICVVGKRKSTWPIIAWSLYSSYTERFYFPASTVSVVELRAYTNTGEVHTINPETLLSVTRDRLSKTIVANAFDDSDMRLRDSSRRYLIRAVQRAVSKERVFERSHSEVADIKTVEAWEISYQVQPLAIPPLEKAAPEAEVLLGRFAKTDIAETQRGGENENF